MRVNYRHCCHHHLKEEEELGEEEEEGVGEEGEGEEGEEIQQARIVLLPGSQQLTWQIHHHQCHHLEVLQVYT